MHTSPSRWQNTSSSEGHPSSAHTIGSMSPTSGAGRPPRVKDVAKLAGVSVSTVSNVLNTPDRVAASTRRRVEDAVAELGFVRNESARQLRAGQSRTVAFVASDATNPFFMEVALGAEDVAEDADLSLITCNSHQDLRRQGAYLRRLEQQRVLGILLTPVAGEDALIASLPARGIPVVLLDERSSDGAHCSVSVDDRLGGRLAAQHLVERGRRRIAFVGPTAIRQVHERREGARSALLDLGLSASALVDVQTDAPTIEEGRRCATRIADLPPHERPTAAFCANDLLAIGFIRGCVDAGIAVPEDLAVVGYDDILFAETAAIPLTSVAGPSRELGRTAAQLLLDESTNPEHAHRQLRFAPKLVVRASTG